MKKLGTFFLILVWLVACGGGQQATQSDANSETMSETKEIEPTAEPTAVATESAFPSDISDEAALVGLWDGTLAGEHGYLVFAEDGTYFLGLNQETVLSEPRVMGEYWLADGQFHLHDLENAGHWAECDKEGVYGTAVADDGTLTFMTIDDECNEGGFARTYVMENTKWDRVGPVPETAMPAEEAEDAEDAMEAQADAEALGLALQDIVDSYVGDQNSGAVLLVDAPDVGFTWKGAAGMADPAASVEMIPDDQFIISSGTKMYTAVTILKLVEAGKLNLDEPISSYLPVELVSQIHLLDGQSYGEQITVRQLLNHTSGLGDFSNGVDEDGNGVSDFKELVLAEPETMWDSDMVLAWAIENAPPVAVPGEQFFYSDTNYQLLAQIIEKVSGMTLPAAYRQFIFEPLDMAHTYFEFGEDVVAGVNGRSVSHAFFNGTDWNELKSHSYEFGSGGIVSNVEDQNRFLRAWVNGDLFDDPASKEAMTSWLNTEAGCGYYYGLGVMQLVFEECGMLGLGTAQGHGGLFNSQAFYWPEQNVTIIGTLNSNEPELGFIGMMLDTMAAVQSQLP